MKGIDLDLIQIPALKNKPIIIELKDKIQYRGTLVAFDGRLNLKLRDAQEWRNGEFQDSIGEKLVRNDRILKVMPGGK